MAGAVLIGLAFVLEACLKWQGVSEETLVAIGAALLLAGVLFFVERRFLRDVGQIATQEATKAADARIDESTRSLQIRLDQLAERMDEEIGARDAAHDEAVRAMDTPSFENIAAALARANSLGALKNGHVTVQGSRDPDELGLEFSWGTTVGDGRFEVPGKISLTVNAIVYADFHISGGRPVIEVDWGSGRTPDQDEPPEAVGLRLIEQLQIRGRWNGSGTLDWPTALRNLQRAIDLAIRSRRREEGATILQGPLAELLGDEWAITEAGIESLDHEFIFSGSEFPDRSHPGARRASQSWSPAPPAWVDEPTWDRLLERGGRLFPSGRGPYVVSPSWIPSSKRPRELRAELEADPF